MGEDGDEGESVENNTMMKYFGKIYAANGLAHPRLLIGPGFIRDFVLAYGKVFCAIII